VRAKLTGKAFIRVGISARTANQHRCSGRVDQGLRENVPKGIYENLLNHHSVGSYYVDYIKGNYECKKYNRVPLLINSGVVEIEDKFYVEMIVSPEVKEMKTIIIANIDKKEASNIVKSMLIKSLNSATEKEIEELYQEYK